MLDRATALGRVLQNFPEFENFRDIYWGNDNGDETPFCIDMARLGDYVWEESVRSPDFDYIEFKSLIINLISEGDDYVWYCVDVCLIDKLDQRDSETADTDLTKRWLMEMSPLLEERSVYWRTKRKKMFGLE